MVIPLSFPLPESRPTHYIRLHRRVFYFYFSTLLLREEQLAKTQAGTVKKKSGCLHVAACLNHVVCDLTLSQNHFGWLNKTREPVWPSGKALGW